MKNTPGPWKVHNKDCVTIMNTDRARPKPDECIVQTCGPNAEADARLIAAAPEMLDALEAVLESVTGCFRDVWRGGGHDTEHYCPMCNCTTGHEEDCPMPKVIEAIKTARGEK